MIRSQLRCSRVIRRRAAAAAPIRPAAPPLQRKIRKVGAPLGVIIVLGTVAGLIVIGLTAVNPVGTAIGFVLSSVAMTVVLLAYLWLDRWEPEPPRLLVLAFLWGASVAVVLSTILQLFARSRDQPGQTETVSPMSIVARRAADRGGGQGAVSAAHDDRPAPQRAELADRLPGLRGARRRGLRLAGGHPVHRRWRVGLPIRWLTAALRLIMAPFAHSLFTTMFGIGVYFALQQRNAARQGRLHPARLRRRGDHARAVERLVAAELRGVLPGLRVLDGAGLRAGDRRLASAAAAGSSASSPPSCPAWSRPAW